MGQVSTMAVTLRDAGNQKAVINVNDFDPVKHAADEAADFSGFDFKTAPIRAIKAALQQVEDLETLGEISDGEEDGDKRKGVFRAIQVRRDELEAAAEAEAEESEEDPKEE